MTLNIENYFNHIKNDFSKMTRPERYRKILLDQIGNPYLWGKENQAGADCSGSVCLALMACGWKIRTTADELLKKIFTEKSGEYEALFYITKKEQKHGNRIVPPGTAIHIMGCVGEDVILNMTPPKARIEPFVNAINDGRDWGYEVVSGAASIEALEKYSGKLFFGIDLELKVIFDEN